MLGGALADELPVVWRHGARLQEIASRAGAWGGVSDQSALYRCARFAVLALLVVFTRNWRSPGMWLMRVRRVEAQTGRRLSVRTAAVRYNAKDVVSVALAPLLSPLIGRSLSKLSEIGPELKQLQRKHAGDSSEVLEHEILQLYKARRVHPFGWFGWGLASRVGLELPALWSQRNQDLIDRVARTVMIFDR